MIFAILYCQKLSRKENFAVSRFSQNREIKFFKISSFFFANLEIKFRKIVKKRKNEFLETRYERWQLK